MLYLGIDIGKRNHVASLLDEKGKVVFKAFSFSNTTEGGISLLEQLGTLRKLLARISSWKNGIIPQFKKGVWDEINL